MLIKIVFFTGSGDSEPPRRVENNRQTKKHTIDIDEFCQVKLVLDQNIIDFKLSDFTSLVSPPTSGCDCKAQLQIFSMWSFMFLKYKFQEKSGHDKKSFDCICENVKKLGYETLRFKVNGAEYLLRNMKDFITDHDLSILEEYELKLNRQKTKIIEKAYNLCHGY